MDENFIVDFGEVTRVITEDFNKLNNRPSYAGELMTGDTNIPQVPSSVSELNNDSNYQTGAQVSEAIETEKEAREAADTALDGRLTTVEGIAATISNLQTAVDGKQDKLIAGANINIAADGKTISATDTTYTAGNAIDITNGEISADIHPADFFTASDSISDCGSNLSLDNTIATKLKSVELKGDTFQQTAPNPDYPQDVQVVTGEQTVDVTGKNKINGSYSEISQTVRCTAEASGNGFKITSTSSSGATYVTVPIPNITSLLGQTVTLSCSSSGSGVRIGFFYLNSSEAAAGNISYTETTTLPASLGDNAGIGIVFYTSNNSSATYNDIQLEIGSTATAYEPYQSQSYTVDLGPIELCKIGDYQDYIYKSGDDWYVHKAMGKITLDGSETWSATQMTNNWMYYTINAGMATVTSSQVPKIVSNYFSVTTTDGQWTSVAGSKSVALNNTASPNTQIRFTVGDSTNKLADFKTWLSAHNTIVYYALATPTETKITDADLVAQLNAVAGAKSYNNQTNIVVTAAGENLPAILCVGAYQKSLNGLLGAIERLG